LFGYSALCISKGDAKLGLREFGYLSPNLKPGLSRFWTVTKKKAPYIKVPFNNNQIVRINYLFEVGGDPPGPPVVGAAGGGEATPPAIAGQFVLPSSTANEFPLRPKPINDMKLKIVITLAIFILILLIKI